MRDDPIELSDHSQAAERNISGYTGLVRMEGSAQEVSVQKAAEFVGCGPILDRHGRWALTSFGVEFLGMYYAIPSDRVHEPDWLEHLSRKTWFDTDDQRDFEAVWEKAKKKWPKPR